MHTYFSRFEKAGEGQTAMETQGSTADSPTDVIVKKDSNTTTSSRTPPTESSSSGYRRSLDSELRRGSNDDSQSKGRPSVSSKRTGHSNISRPRTPAERKECTIFCDAIRKHADNAEPLERLLNDPEASSRVNERCEACRDFPIHIAMDTGRTSHLQALLQYRAVDTDVKNNSNMTPLVQACIDGYLKAVDALIDANCKCDIDVCASVLYLKLDFEVRERIKGLRKNLKKKKKPSKKRK
ncbi:hypothetical protein EJ04DRAFT_525030 [Polyplosphaeria fusca]|uniref:Uncharacterized protein n=1 Tax=Polyplosphaeria fusca TaxID=682080 RepID=A0A9P4QUP7_9PLEO|nr:hypothetical protein EJ04DRAFT_525030 [Polyplosphaeria fusca]